VRVCFFGTFRSHYIRNELMIAALRSAGVEVIICHAPLWRGVEDRVRQASGGWRQPAFWLRVVRAYWRLLRQHWRTPDYDLMWVGYPGQFDVYLGRLLAWWRRRPMVLDILMSLYLIAQERGLTQKSPLTGRIIFWLEKHGLRLPDRLIADTPEYRDYYCHQYNLDPDDFLFVPMGIDEHAFYPRPELKPPDGCFRVLYVGTYLPLHGLDTIVRAAAALQRQPEIVFDFYGEGQEEAPTQALARTLGANNVRFHGWVEQERIPELMAESHVVLGVFGATQQSLRTIPNKIWQGLAMRRPVITGEGPAVGRELSHHQNVYLVERSNPEALAQAILELKANPTLAANIAAGGYDYVQQHSTARALGRQAASVLRPLLRDNRPGSG
jgi:glycosyltransferase involved in cell wall biosynthesis